MISIKSCPVDCQPHTHITTTFRRESEKIVQKWIQTSQKQQQTIVMMMMMMMMI